MLEPMFRTSVSFVLLFGCLFIVSKALETSQAQDRMRGERTPSLRTADRRAARTARGLRGAGQRRAAPSAAAERQPRAPLPAPPQYDRESGDDSAATATQAPSAGVRPALPSVLLTAPEIDREVDMDDLQPSAASSSPDATTRGEATEAAAAPQDQSQAGPPRDGKDFDADDFNADDFDADDFSLPPQFDPDLEFATQLAPARPATDRPAPVITSVLPGADATARAEEEPSEPSATDGVDNQGARRDLDAFGDLAAPLGDEAAAVPADARPERQSEVAVSEDYPSDLEPLREQLRDVLAYYLERPDHAERRAPWGVMHCFIAYGVDTELLSGGQRVNAIAYLCWNGPCRGQRLLGVDRHGLMAREGIGVQGHPGQFLAMLAQSKVKSDYPLRVNDREFTVADLIQYEQATCQEKTELTFKLIGLVHYLDSDATWKNRQGQDWDLPKLIKEELAQPVIGAACGGTHRMMGFSYAVRKRERTGGEMNGQWLRAKKYVDSYHDYTFKLQNADGSFSTNWFHGPGSLGDEKRRLETTGHTLEWLVYSLPQQELTSPRVIKSVEYLTKMLWEGREDQWEVGPKGHALHALALYDERVFGGQPGQRRVELASRMARQPHSSR